MGLRARTEAGFSIIELMIAMAVTMVVMTAATTLLASSLKVRVRENQKSDALADAQRALNIMSRDISNAGFGLDYNGIVIADSSQTSIRIRSNSCNYSGCNSAATSDRDEDVIYVLQGSNAIVRYDPASTPTTVSLASRINTLQFSYYDYSYDSSGNLVTSGPNTAPTVNTGRVRITVSVTLDAVGSQAATQVQLTSDVTLRNTPFMLGRY